MVKHKVAHRKWSLQFKKEKKLKQKQRGVAESEETPRKRTCKRKHLENKSAEYGEHQEKTRNTDETETVREKSSRKRTGLIFQN